MDVTYGSVPPNYFPAIKPYTKPGSIGIFLSSNTVLTGAAIGTVIGHLMGSSSDMVLSIVSGPFTVSDDDDLELNGPTGAANSVLTVRVKAERLVPFLSITQDITVDVLAAQFALSPLSINDVTAPLTAGVGDLLAELGDPLEDETRSIVPNDGRVVFNSEQSALIVGEAAWSPGATDYIIYRDHPDANNGPLGTPWRLTIEDAPPLPEFIVLPSIDGVTRVGQTLTADPGQCSEEPILSTTYQWYVGVDPSGADAVSLPGSIEETLLLVDDHEGKYIRVGVVFTTAGGASAEGFSEPAGPIELIPAVNITISNVTLPDLTWALTDVADIEISGLSGPYTVEIAGAPAGWTIVGAA